MLNKIFFVIVLVGCSYNGFTQRNGDGLVKTTVRDESSQPLNGATVELRRAIDSALVKSGFTDSSGQVIISHASNGKHFLLISMVNFEPRYSNIFETSAVPVVLPDVVLTQRLGMLDQVTVSVKKPFVQLMADKTVVNVEAGITNAGATVMEVLEKSPGITVDKDGNISLKGKQNLLILIDGKPTYLPSADIAQMLGGMSASQVELVEIMDNPPAKYDASGNGGVINIKTKKLRQKGFNGNLSTSFGQGHYYKNNNSLSLNYRHNNVHLFLTYSSVFNKSFTDLYAERSYFEAGTSKVASQLVQVNWLTGALRNHTLRAGADISLSKQTTIGFAATGLNIGRDGAGDATGNWRGAGNITDSLINTYSTSQNRFKNLGGNINFRHNFSKNSELTADVDYLDYTLQSHQVFDNVVRFPSPYTESIKGNLPSSISILSGKIDYHTKLKENISFDAGLKTSRVETDNLAAYELQQNGAWEKDYSKTNHFLYNENINAAYITVDQQAGKLSLQGGLRYEHTRYDAEQKGNPFRLDSAFNKKYDGFFPTLFAQFKADSSHSFSFSAGRRIDRPAYQKLNPFVFVINKYTYQKGNPLFQPQYTWNFQLSHQFRDLFVTTISYNVTKNYFSQIFLSEPNDILIYSEGNLGRMRNVGISVSTQVDVTSWWSLNSQANLYNKKIEGTIWADRQTALTQFNMNLNNQFRLGKGWAAELSGFFVTKEQELQEITDPTGQLIVGVAKQVLKNKGSLKLTLRDIFYTQAMKGDTEFEQAFEYFKLTRDTRVLTLAFTYRFGKSFKGAAKRNGASEEMERVGSGD
ncbi:MAG: TonB-dependent receptor [Chitinophagaceae bacterium]|nr:MAG: TonB-dependent receptor [Chitinophagaceae bacterium]